MTGAMYTYISTRNLHNGSGFHGGNVRGQCKPIPYMSIIDLSQPNHTKLAQDF
jgi:hypothetical protein